MSGSKSGGDLVTVHGEGGPRSKSDLRALIKKMSIENPLWGAPRIHGELLKLGFDSCEPMPAITTTSEPTGPWLKMHRSLVPSSGPEASGHTRSSAGFITTTSGSRFSVQTPPREPERSSCPPAGASFCAHYKAYEWPKTAFSPHPRLPTPYRAFVDEMLASSHTGMTGAA